MPDIILVAPIVALLVWYFVKRETMPFPLLAIAHGVVSTTTGVVSVVPWMLARALKALADRGYLPSVFGPLYRGFRGLHGWVQKGFYSHCAAVGKLGRPKKRPRKPNR